MFIFFEDRGMSTNGGGRLFNNKVRKKDDARLDSAQLVNSLIKGLGTEIS